MTNTKALLSHHYLLAALALLAVVIALIFAVPGANAQDATNPPPPAEGETEAPDDGWVPPSAWDDGMPVPGANGAPPPYTNRMAVGMTGVLPPPLPPRPLLATSMIADPIVVVGGNNQAVAVADGKDDSKPPTPPVAPPLQMAGFIHGLGQVTNAAMPCGCITHPVPRRGSGYSTIGSPMVVVPSTGNPVILLPGVDPCGCVWVLRIPMTQRRHGLEPKLFQGSAVMGHVMFVGGTGVQIDMSVVDPVPPR